MWMYSHHTIRWGWCVSHGCAVTPCHGVRSVLQGPPHEAHTTFLSFFLSLFFQCFSTCTIQYWNFIFIKDEDKKYGVLTLLQKWALATAKTVANRFYRQLTVRLSIVEPTNSIALYVTRYRYFTNYLWQKNWLVNEEF